MSRQTTKQRYIFQKPIKTFIPYMTETEVARVNVKTGNKESNQTVYLKLSHSCHNICKLQLTHKYLSDLVGSTGTAILLVFLSFRNADRCCLSSKSLKLESKLNHQ